LGQLLNHRNQLQDGCVVYGTWHRTSFLVYTLTNSWVEKAICPLAADS
jgi:hypothetical protein